MFWANGSSYICPQHMRSILITLGLVALSFGMSAQSITQKKDLFGITFDDKFVVKAKYSSIVPLDEEHAKVKCYALQQEGKWDILFLNDGEEFGTRAKDLSFEYDTLYLLTNGVAIGKVGELSRIIQINNWRLDPNSPARQILGPECDAVSLWKERMPEFIAGENEPIWFQLKGKQGMVMNVAGKAMPNFRMILTGVDSIVQFGDKLNPLQVYMGNKIGLLDLVKKQGYIFPPKYEAIDYIPWADFEQVEEGRDRYYKVKEHGLWGLTFITEAGETSIAEPEYEDILQMDSTHLFEVRKSGKSGVIAVKPADGSVTTLINPGYDEVLASASSDPGFEREYFYSLKFDGKYGFGKLNAGEVDKFELISIPKFEELRDIDFESGEEGYVTFDYKLGGKWGYVIYFNNGKKKEVQAKYEDIYFAHHQDIAMHFTEKEGKLFFNPHNDYSSLYVKEYHKSFSEGMLELDLAIPKLNEVGIVLLIVDDRKHETKTLKEFGFEIEGEVLQLKEVIPLPVWEKFVQNLETSNFLLEGAKIPAQKLFVPFEGSLKMSGNWKLGSKESGSAKFAEYLEEEGKVMDVEYSYSSEGQLTQVHLGHIIRRYTYSENNIVAEYYEPGSNSKTDRKQAFEVDSSGTLLSASEWKTDLSGLKSVFQYGPEGRLTGFQEFLLDPQKKKFMGNGVYAFNFSGDTLMSITHTDNQAKLEGLKYENLPARLMSLEYDVDLNPYGVKVELLPDTLPDPDGSYYEVEFSPEGFQKAILYNPQDSILNEISDPGELQSIPALKLFAPIERMD
jgi:hypothetical protein